jgi:hypothetical protein
MNGIKFDSPEEEMFFYWCEEAKEKGVIKDFVYHPESYRLTDPVKITEIIHYLTPAKREPRTKEKTTTLLQSLDYTPDFQILVEPKENDLFKEYGLKAPREFDKNTFWYTIDIKGMFSPHGDNEKFPVIQKIFYLTHNIYSNKVIPHKFFLKAWLPKARKEKGDLIFTDYKVLKDGTIKEQRKRKRFEACETFIEKY